MIINDKLCELNLTKYKLSQESGVPQATINDICSGKADIEKCAAGTLFRIANVLGITVEDIIISSRSDYRASFETFKSNVCHQVKDKGDLDFIIETLENNEVRHLFEKKWYPESLYLLGMVDYLSRLNGLPECKNYNDIRSTKLSKTIYPIGVILNSEVTKSDEPIRKAEENAIPEFRRFNIIESEIRNVVLNE